MKLLAAFLFLFSVPVLAEPINSFFIEGAPTSFYMENDIENNRFCVFTVIGEKTLITSSTCVRYYPNGFNFILNSKDYNISCIEDGKAHLGLCKSDKNFDVVPAKLNKNQLKFKEIVTIIDINKNKVNEINVRVGHVAGYQASSYPQYKYAFDTNLAPPLFGGRFSFMARTDLGLPVFKDNLLVGIVRAGMTGMNHTIISAVSIQSEWIEKYAVDNSLTICGINSECLPQNIIEIPSIPFGCEIEGEIIFDLVEDIERWSEHLPYCAVTA